MSRGSDRGHDHFEIFAFVPFGLLSRRGRLWYRASYYAEGARPLTLMDLECEWIEQHGGIRLYIDEGGLLQAELKALDKPKFKQSPKTAIRFRSTVGSMSGLTSCCRTIPMAWFRFGRAER